MAIYETNYTWIDTDDFETPEEVTSSIKDVYISVDELCEECPRAEWCDTYLRKPEDGDCLHEYEAEPLLDIIKALVEFKNKMTAKEAA